MTGNPARFYSFGIRNFFRELRCVNTLKAFMYYDYNTAPLIKVNKNIKRAELMPNAFSYSHLFSRYLVYVFPLLYTEYAGRKYKEQQIQQDANDSRKHNRRNAVWKQQWNLERIVTIRQ